MLLLGAMAALALLLAGVGVYGLLSYTVLGRRREFGIRMALGASRADVVSSVLQGGVLIALTGLAVGGVAGLGFGRLASSLLYSVEPRDAMTYAAAAAVLLVSTIAACCVPALRASRVDPAQALRHE
jgi:ABC-type antimicrobial peptide transport system permease subunit